MNKVIHTAVLLSVLSCLVGSSLASTQVGEMIVLESTGPDAVSYTHLTLPTSAIV